MTTTTHRCSDERIRHIRSGTLTCPDRCEDTGRADLDDIAVLAVPGRIFGHVSTWAWDCADESAALLCEVCWSTTHPDDPEDGDRCTGTVEDDRGREWPCGSHSTRRVIVHVESLAGGVLATSIVRPDLAA